MITWMPDLLPGQLHGLLSQYLLEPVPHCKEKLQKSGIDANDLLAIVLPPHAPSGLRFARDVRWPEHVHPKIKMARGAALISDSEMPLCDISYSYDR